MSKIPPNERPTPQQLKAGSKQQITVRGKPAEICPYCGCAMFVNGTRRGDKDKLQYVQCRNCVDSSGKPRSFTARQPPATLVREIGVDDELPSSSGQASLTLVRDAG